MKALNTLEPSPCPTNCLFSYMVINQNYPCHFYCATVGAIMSKVLTAKGVFHSCPWILDQVLWDENGLCAGGATCGPSRLWVLIAVKFSDDAETPQKALLRPLLPQCPKKPTASPFRGKRHCLQPAIKQNKSVGLCSLLLYFSLEVFEADCVLQVCELICHPVHPLYAAITERKIHYEKMILFASCTQW